MRITLLLLLVSVTLLAQDALLIKNATIHPIVGPDIAKGSVLIEKGRIKEVGATIKAPPKVKTIDATGLHVYPGIIDAASTLGLEEISAVSETRDVNEIGEFNPQIRALISVNPSSEHIPVTRANGVTSAISMLGGGVIGGQAALIHLDGWTWEEMEAKRNAGVSMNFPTIRTSARGGIGPTRTYTEAKRQHDERIKSLENFFEEARRYQKAKDARRPDFLPNNKLEGMLPIIERRVPMMVTAQLEREIDEAIEFAERQRINIVLFNVREPGKALDKIVAKKIPVVLGPTFTLPLNEDDPYDKPYAMPKLLHEKGVMFAFGSFDSQFARNVPYQAANAVGYGLSAKAAVEALTINAARMFGLEQELGSIEPGKLANLVVTDGDLLEVRTNVKNVIIRGKDVPLMNKHLELYEKYKSRPAASK